MAIRTTEDLDRVLDGFEHELEQMELDDEVSDVPPVIPVEQDPALQRLRDMALRNDIPTNTTSNTPIKPRPKPRRRRRHTVETTKPSSTVDAIFWSFWVSYNLMGNFVSHQDPHVEWIARESSCSIELTGERRPALFGGVQFRVVISARSEGHFSKCIEMLMKTFPDCQAHMGDFYFPRGMMMM